MPLAHWPALRRIKVRYTTDVKAAHGHSVTVSATVYNALEEVDMTESCLERVWLFDHVIWIS
jgi:hypothetical protein